MKFILLEKDLPLISHIYSFIFYNNRKGPCRNVKTINDLIACKIVSTIIGNIGERQFQKDFPTAKPLNNEHLKTMEVLTNTVFNKFKAKHYDTVVFLDKNKKITGIDINTYKPVKKTICHYYDSDFIYNGNCVDVKVKHGGAKKVFFGRQIHYNILYYIYELNATRNDIINYIKQNNNGIFNKIKQQLQLKSNKTIEEMEGLL